MAEPTSRDQMYPNDSSILKDRVILIVGAGRHPAPGLALALAAQGAIIAANDLSPVLLDPLVQAARVQEGRIHAYVADATRGMPLRAMLDEIIEHWGRIDVLINNPRIQPNTPLITMDEWDWQRTVDMNLNGPFLVSQLVAKIMKEQGQGTILNLVDANGPVLDQPGLAAYAATQQALLALSQAAAREFITYNIHVHTICPDETLLYDEQRHAEAQPAPPSSNPVPGGDLTGLVVFLCGPQAAHLAGQVHRVSRQQE